MSSTTSPLSPSSVNFEVGNKQRTATIVEGGPNVKAASSFFKKSLTSTLLLECCMLRRVRFCGDSVVLSDQDLSCAPVRTHNGSGSYFHFCPRPCSSTCPWAKLSTTDTRDHTNAWSVLSRSFGRVTTARVSSPKRLGAVSMGSHMQQEMDISQAPPHLGAPFALFEHRSRLKTTIQKIGDNFS